MACPHSLVGDPRMCSQCARATPRVATRDPATGQPLLDGLPALGADGAPRPYVLGPAEHLVAHYRRGSRASGQARRKR